MIYLTSANGRAPWQDGISFAVHSRALACDRFHGWRCAQELYQQPWHNAVQRGGQSEPMNEVKRRFAPVMLFQKPANPLVDGVGDFLKPLLGDGKFIAERDPCVVKKH